MVFNYPFHYRNLCAKDWKAANPIGTTAAFKRYYKDLSADERKVSLHPSYLLHCAMLTRRIHTEIRTPVEGVGTSFTHLGYVADSSCDFVPRTRQGNRQSQVPESVEKWRTSMSTWGVPVCQRGAGFRFCARCGICLMLMVQQIVSVLRIDPYHFCSDFIRRMCN